MRAFCRTVEGIKRRALLVRMEEGVFVAVNRETGRTEGHPVGTVICVKEKF